MSPILTGFPFAGGGTAKATITSTTGSPTVDTSSRPGKTIYKFTGSGSITVGTAGTCEILVIAGGGSGGSGNVNVSPTTGGNGGGGAGGLLYDTSAYLASGNLTVTVGAGGASIDGFAAPGNFSRVGTYYAIGGGLGGGTGSFGLLRGVACNGGSGGGQYISNGATAGTGVTGQGNNGGTATGSGANGGGGGGGAGAAGGNATTTAGAAGGNGSANSITGSSVTYAGGGGGGSRSTSGGSGGTGGGGTGGPIGGSASAGAGTAGTANTGSGGGGSGLYYDSGLDLYFGTAGGAGGSGYVVVVVG